MAYEIESQLKREIDIFDIGEFLYSKGVKNLSSSDQVITFLKKLDYNSYGSPIESIVVSDQTLIPEGIQIAIFKKRYKVKGEIWIVHKNDADPFPSLPHAHNYDQNLVLHLGSGELFQNRKSIGKANRKRFLKLREKIETDLPPLE